MGLTRAISLAQRSSTGPIHSFSIAGAGEIARTHAEVIKHRLNEADLVAICDISLEILTRFGDAFEVPGAISIWARCSTTRH